MSSTTRNYYGPTLHQGQLKIANAILSNPDVKYHVVVTPRQFGKTFFGIQLALYWAINKPGVKVFWVSPQYSQATKVMKDLYNGVRDSDIVKNYNKGDLIIELINGSEIHFKSIQNQDAMRGYSVDYMILDEFAFFPEGSWNEVLKPTLLVRGKQAMFISTPKGKNIFYDLYNLGTSEDFPNYMSHRGHHIDNPYADKQEIEDARKVLPENIYKQEYEGEFIDDGGSVFTNVSLAVTDKYWKVHDPKKKYYAGIDTGNQNDYTVCTIIDEDGNVVDVYYNRETTWSMHINNIVRILVKWNAQALLEINHNGAIIEEIQKQYKAVQPFVTTASSKPDIIEKLIMRFQDNTITIPSQFPELINELKAFTFHYNPKTRNVRYEAPIGVHDDTVMSLAIAMEAIKQRINKGSYAIGILNASR